MNNVISRGIFKFILTLEGVDLSKDPNDPGGDTKYGISKRYNPEVDIINLTEEQAYEIYKKKYFVIFKSPIISCIYNAHNILSPARLKKAVKSTFNTDSILELEGIFSSLKGDDYMKSMDRLNKSFFDEMKKSKSWKIYHRGWTNRIHKCAPIKLISIHIQMMNEFEDEYKKCLLDDIINILNITTHENHVECPMMNNFSNMIKDTLSDLIKSK